MHNHCKAAAKISHCTAQVQSQIAVEISHCTAQLQSQIAVEISHCTAQLQPQIAVEISHCTAQLQPQRCTTASLHQQFKVYLPELSPSILTIKMVRTDSKY